MVAICCGSGTARNRTIAIRGFWTSTSLTATATCGFPPVTLPATRTVTEHFPAISPPVIQTGTVHHCPATLPAIRTATVDYPPGISLPVIRIATSRHSLATLPEIPTATLNHSSPISPDCHFWTFALPGCHFGIATFHFRRKPATVSGTFRNGATRHHFPRTAGKRSIRTGTVAIRPEIANVTCPTHEPENSAAIRTD